MKLNTIKPAEGATKASKRVGRGIGSGLGKTCGRGHKGQKSRSGGFHKVGFEGGQLPIHKRLPKFGFTSQMADSRAELCLYHLNSIDAADIDLAYLIDNKMVKRGVTKVKIINTGSIERAVNLKGLHVTKGAQEAIEKAGGKVE
ncbi:50S ribosomal protein L15 [Marinicella litoralis]|uniref:Large ribosomal subunit protein uL15 n=1 Tax=Marinicella litoralis TaxID=644220 RepID=A0A4R6XIT0_9GAMM|nr:50S ribosomal protein L15 [Marinicella litoralis]TDR19395.1 LSU ribosomal protein L15P [Marinicella litoralis]